VPFFTTTSRVLRRSDNMSKDRDEHVGSTAPAREKRKRSTSDSGGRTAAERKPAHADYTVGWICALQIEYVAAQIFLDEMHQAPEHVHPHDDNCYVLGRIGRHNIVIAVLPNGEYGISSATGVAKNMLSSFPNVRIGLMVGIGGGAPSEKHDIRLGDVVVSAPRDGTGGVFQYDFGKAIQDGTLHTTGFLNQPPTFLLTAVNGLETDYEIHGHQLEESINGVLEKLPRLRRKYARPLPSTDRLYQSAAIHPLLIDENCSNCCDNDSSNMIVRVDRTQEDDNPAIHYGLIASANQVMKDALIRDKLIKEKDVLCFEMEAAGLMNQFPCLVIRGICDYSDSHKNKEWQGYAAMAAAAYTKDLLSRIPPNKVEEENRIIDVLKNVFDGVEKLLSVHYDQEHQNILKWLAPIDFAIQQSEYIKIRQRGTCHWFLASDEYLSWLKSDNQTLFCPGVPGAGKTIMSAAVIDDLLYGRYKDDASVGISYLYCDFRRHNEQKTNDLVANLLKQLIQKQRRIPDCVQILYDEYNEIQKRPSLTELLEALHSVSRLYSKVFILVDALDECQETDGCRRIFLSEILKLQRETNVNIFATSRFVQEIADTFDQSVHFEIRAKDEDVQAFLDSLKTGNLELDDEFIPDRETMASIYAGLVTHDTERDVLRLAHYTIQDYFEKEGKFWISDAETDITTVCVTYLSFRAFESGICKTQFEYDQRLASNVLYHYAANYWGHHARASTNTQPILEFLHSEAKVSAADQALERGRRFFDDLGGGRIGFHLAAHFGLKNIATRLLEDGQSVNARDRRGYTPIVCAIRGGHRAMVEHLLKLGAKANSKDYRGRTPLFEAISHADDAVVKLLLGNGAQVKMADWKGRTPLYYASDIGDMGIAMLLLQSGADVDVPNNYGQTPLFQASGSGHEDIVRLLLNLGAEVDAADQDGRTPLLCASQWGHANIAQVLIENGAEVDAPDNDGQTPLATASSLGHKDIVKALLENGAGVHAVNADGHTPLSLANFHGRKEIFKLLLEHGAGAIEFDTES
ncbi:hypothetical protein MKX08_006820, partial [Trichoderma sp. CBMAI-0020]